jgi:hypothetical protein
MSAGANETQAGLGARNTASSLGSSRSFADISQADTSAPPSPQVGGYGDPYQGNAEGGKARTVLDSRNDGELAAFL